MPYIPHTSQDIREMLAQIGCNSVEELFQDIPAELQMQAPYRIPKGLGEMELWQHMQSLAAKNATTDEKTSFLGGGMYDHFIPVLVDYLSGRSEFWTSYTPYQPEASQGNLQAIFEYQTIICELTGMDIANASIYDGATSLAEAVLLSYFHHKQKRDTVLVAPGIHPEHQEILLTYTKNLGVKLQVLPEKDGMVDLEKMPSCLHNKILSVVVANPNFYGIVEDLEAISKAAKSVGALSVALVNPISLGMLEPPGACGVDIAVGDGQPMGIPMSYGGPSFGFFAAKEEYLRKMPGRIAGQTVDIEGKRGFVLTIQTREQHIRREKATSNICTNQALMALRGLIYTVCLGKEGFREVANQCLQKAHYLASKIEGIQGFSLCYKSPFFHEFLVHCPVPANEIFNALSEKGIYAGIALTRWHPERTHDLLIAVTENRSKKEMDALTHEFEKFAR